MIGRAWQPAARICTASLGPLRDRLWAGQRQGRIPSAISFAVSVTDKIYLPNHIMAYVHRLLILFDRT